MPPTSRPLTPLEAATVDCKTAIKDAVAAALATFQDRTGIGPTGVELRFVDVSTYGDEVRRHALATVILHFDV